MMIDLTFKFRKSFKLKEEIAFDYQRWLDAFSKLVDNIGIEYMWDEEEDNWLKLGTHDNVFLMAARHIPFVFFCNSELMEIFKAVYNKGFEYEIVRDPNSQTYCVDASEINKWFEWRTDIVNTNKFSINDLFYATH